MKHFALILTLVVTTKLFASEHHPHLPLELTFEESQQLLRQHWVKFGQGMMKANAPETQLAIDGGEKFSKWLKEINNQRSADDQIRLTSGSNRGGGIPIDSPSKYGPKTIKERLQKNMSEIPASIKDVVYGNENTTATLPTSKEDFIKYGRMISFLYQTAVRWSTSLEPWLDWYKKNKQRDVRGYYHLKKMSDLNEKLDDFNKLTTKQQEEIKKHMMDICQNNQYSIKACEKAFESNRKKKNLKALKDQLWPAAMATWNSFFEIRNPRTDVSWDASEPNVMKAPFIDPKNEKISNWLKENIEDEFKTATWNFELNFVEEGKDTAYLEFQPNVTPHVTRGNIIVMDANSPIEEYDVKWTIRHEYGHILRIPDCYIEFYDETEEVAVNYQLDVKDLMCSRAGDFNQRLYDELKRVYYKN
jgi:hypothetical protein